MRNYQIAALVAASFISIPFAGAHPLSFETVTPRLASTASEAIFRGPDAVDLPARIASMCMDLEWPVLEQSSNQVLCEGAADTSLAMFGPRGATYKGLVRFNIVPLADRVRVQATSQTTRSNVFGQQTSFSASGSDFLQKVLVNLGGEYPSGTTFKGIDIGARGYIDRSGKNPAFVITELSKPGTAPQSGLLLGDRILKVGKGRVYDQDDLRHMFSRFKVGDTIPVEVERAGQPIQLSLTAQGRDPVP